VIDDFVDTYLRAETPNPCVRCNQYIKFTPLLRRARALGADRVATGHYARIDAVDGRLRLRRGVDASKDQSYFLFSMPADELGSVVFPLGDLDKDEVRRRARGFGLPNAGKPESQEICFVPDGDYAGFVRAAALRRGKSLPPPGSIVDSTGVELGRHDGLHQFTIGQRRGLGDVGAARGRPVYVQRLEPESGRVVVGDEAAARRRRVSVQDVRWFAAPPARPFEARVQVRHRATPARAEVAPGADREVVIAFEDPVIAAPGQAAVFYDDDDGVIGGGWIAAPRCK
jgi:tRNA-specific 2-thiouridylase